MTGHIEQDMHQNSFIGLAPCAAVGRPKRSGHDFSRILRPAHHGTEGDGDRIMKPGWSSGLAMRMRTALSGAARRRGRRAAIAPMTALLAPAFLGMTALIVDAGFWIIGSSRLQVAADAGAMGAGFLLSTSLKGQTGPTQTSTMQSVAACEAQAAATKLVGTLNTSPTVSIASDWSSVTVTFTSQAPSYFPGIFSGGAPVLRASATASVKATPATPCVLTLGTTGTGVQVDNSGTIAATNCSIFSKAKDPNSSIPSIYLNSGVISATVVAAAGAVTQSNSGSNSMTPSNPTSNSSTVYADPLASKSLPAPGACNVTNGNYSAYGTYNFSAAANGGSYVFCGNTVIGGNGSTDSFGPGIYYVVNGNLTFNNAALTNASGISFVLTGSSPGNFSWTNYSNTTTPITAPTTGPTAGVAIWQACNNSGSQTASFQGGSTISVAGTIYMPCSKVDAGNNAQITAQSGQAFNIEAFSIYAHGSAAIRTNAISGSGGNSAGGPVLTQ